MKITQEVRDFARMQEQREASADVDEGMAGAETSDQDVDAGFAQMSKRFHDEGGEIYVPAEN
jgi:hypothetical protein